MGKLLVTVDKTICTDCVRLLVTRKKVGGSKGRESFGHCHLYCRVESSEWHDSRKIRDGCAIRAIQSMYHQYFVHAAESLFSYFYLPVYKIRIRAWNSEIGIASVSLIVCSCTAVWLQEHCFNRWTEKKKREI